jgi:hypothetical protein
MLSFATIAASVCGSMAFMALLRGRGPLGGHARIEVRGNSSERSEPRVTRAMDAALRPIIGCLASSTTTGPLTYFTSSVGPPLHGA